MQRLAKGTENHVLTMGASDPAWAAAAGGGADAFYSEANDLSDVTRTTARVDVGTSSFSTFLNIASGGCRFLGGRISLERDSVNYAEVRVQVDGGTEQTLVGIFEAGGGSHEYYVVLPAIKCDTSLLIRAYNNHGALPSFYSGDSWHRAL